MDATVLEPWRDLSIVWLGLLTMIFVAVPGVVLFFALKYLRRFNRWLRMPFLYARVWALRIQAGTTRAADSIAQVPINLRSTGARASTTAHGVMNFLLNK